MFTHAEPTTGNISTAQKDVRAYAWVVFVLTVGLLLSDYMSRQVLNAVFPMLKATWHLSDTRLGSLSSVVALMVGVVAASPIWLHQLWAFLAPGLHKHEKKYARAFVGAGVTSWPSGTS